MIRILTLFAIGTLAGAATLEPVQLSQTEHLDFPAGGVLRIPDSMGELSIEAWDRPEIEITTIRSAYTAERDKTSRELEKIQVTAKRNGDEVVIATAAPHSIWPAAPKFQIEYRIKAPRDARLVVRHQSGNLYVDNLASDIDATVCQGQILLHLPETGRYAIRADSDFGSVISDFPGAESHHFWRIGHRMDQTASGAHQLNLRVRSGDILILKTHRPMPPPAVQSGDE